MQIENLQIPYGQIYRLTNKINSKSYIGQTTMKIDKRFSKYKNLDCKDQPKIYNALKKYGPENFLFEVIDTSSQNQKLLDDLEIMYIAKLDSIKNGYNCEPGGFGRGKLISNETKHKMSLSHSGKNNYNFGKKMSNEQKLKLSIAHTGKKGPNLGKSMNEQTKLKISQKLQGCNHPNFGKKLSKEVCSKKSQAMKLYYSNLRTN